MVTHLCNMIKNVTSQPYQMSITTVMWSNDPLHQLAVY